MSSQKTNITDSEIKEKDIPEMATEESTEKAIEETSETESKDPFEKENTETPDDDAPKSNPTILIIEAVLAIIAVGFIVFALVINNKKDDSLSSNSASDNTSSGNQVSQNTTSDGVAVDIDNSALYENMPAIPDISTFNEKTVEECEAAVADGTMMKLEFGDGNYAYINNLDDIEYVKSQITPSEEEIDDFVFQNILMNYATLDETTNHTVVENWDLVNVTYVGTLDGVAFEGGSATTDILVGQGGYIPGFEEAMLGMAVGETKDAPITFPENYGQPDLAGKDVIFTFTINSISGSYTFPELSDEIVQEYFYDGTTTTVEDCRNYISNYLTQSSLSRFLLEYYNVSSISEESVTMYYNMLLDTYDYSSKQYGISVEELLTYSGSNLDELKEATINDACQETIDMAICNALAAKYGIEIEDSDITDFAISYGYPDKDTFIADYGEQAVMDAVTQIKVMEYIGSLL